MRDEKAAAVGIALHDTGIRTITEPYTIAGVNPHATVRMSVRGDTLFYICMI
jgi:hypothetical protein